MKYYKLYQQAFGENEFGLIDFPMKISNTKVSRIRNYRTMGGCSFCFPHGYESVNNKYYKIQRSWKKFRQKQWKEK